ncbi:aldehyde dehydrogenase family protein [Rhizorhabdus dicambivorans]|nr:aldehyde dehydrogenase family protein [Rhizorhabdus dicambivorans]
MSTVLMPDSRRYALLIDGRLEEGAAEFGIVDPARGAVFAQAPDASRTQLDEAVAAARRAQPGWGGLSDEERRHHLGRFAEGIRQQAAEIANVFTREQGQPFAHATREILGATRLIEAVSRVEVQPELIFEAEGVRRELHYRPLGVVGAITPWNVPITMAAGKIAEGLQAGNTMVLKPSPYTPLGTLMLGEIAAETLPAGVLNILSGGNDLGAWMVEHPGINMITFTGSTATGKRIGAAASTHGLKRIVLELGGNDAAIVLDDVDVATAAPRIFRAAFLNSGQVCMAIKRLYVHESKFDDMRAALVELAIEAKLGDGLEPGVTMGPLQNKMQYERVIELMQDAAAHGAVFETGGEALARDGYFIPPTIATGISDGVRLVDEEQFGPVLPIVRYTDIDDAIARANNSPYGLSGSIWTSDVKRGYALARRLEVGTAWVNKHLEPSVDAPFGGAKESGLGRVMSVVGAKTYMEPQVVDIQA